MAFMEQQRAGNAVETLFCILFAGDLSWRPLCSLGTDLHSRKRSSATPMLAARGRISGIPLDRQADGALMPGGPTIMIVNPNTTLSMTEEMVAAARTVVAPGTCVVGGTATRGVASVESNADEIWGALSVLEQVRAGEEGGVSGYVIACFGDTGLAAAKELALGPAVGMTEAALFTAAVLAARFCIVTLPPRTREQSHRVLRETGLAGRCTVRAIDLLVSEIADGHRRVLEAMKTEARLAIEEDAAEAIVLGCAGLAGLVQPLQSALGVPVVEGVAAALKSVEALLAQGLSTSRAGTFAPGRETRR